MDKVVLVLIASYLLGSLPPGLFWAWIARKIDVRRHGSGRTGGTNVWRSAGFPAALLTAIFDALKGTAAVFVARWAGLSPWEQALAGTFAVVGHNYSVFLGFDGGAGTATSVGVTSALWLPSLPIVVLSGTAAGLLVGHASVASIFVALMLPLLHLVAGSVPYAVGFGLPAMALTLWALRPNIKRLINGEERFLPIYHKKPPLIKLSHHPTDRSAKS
jgi:acyl phosphate:glycerol-3-phosphate acyltransferase